MTDHANEAAATSAGWKKLQIDRGSGFSPRYITEFHQCLHGAATGGANYVGGRGESDASAAAADTAALASLNKYRVLHYGGAGATAGKDGYGNAHTFDVT